MRLCLFMMLVLCHLSTLSQITDERRDLTIILQQLEREHEISFSYRDQNVGKYRVLLPVSGQPLKTTLDNISLQTQLLFEWVDERHIIIYLAPELQTRNICGYLLDDITSAPCSYASISTSDGSTFTYTDDSGYYELTIRHDNQLVASYLGCKDLLINTLISQGGHCPIYHMKQDVQLSEIVLTEYLFDGIQQSKDAHDIIISPDDLNIMPGSVESDVLAAVQFLPGIYATSESLNSIHIRGGTADQNLFLWDNIPVYHTSHFFGNISAFNPAVISDVNVHRSAISSQYGGRASGVIDISSRDSIPEKIDMQLNANMTHAGIASSIPLWSNAGLILSLRRSINDEWASPTFLRYAEKSFQGTKVEDGDFGNPDLEANDLFNFSDGSFKFIYAPGKNTFTLSSIGGLNALDYYAELPNFEAYSVDDLDLKNGAAKLAWSRQWTDKLKSTLELTNSYYRYDYQLSFRQNEQMGDPPIRYNSLSQIEDNGFKLNFNYDFTSLQKFNFGVQTTENIILLEIGKKEFNNVENNVQNFRNELQSLHGEYTLTVPDILELDIGLRYQYQSIIKNNYFEPRISAVTRVTDHLKLKVSTSKQFQFISQLVVLDVNDLNLGNQIWVATNNTTIPVIESNQWTGGIVWQQGSWTLDIEGYVKELAGITTLTSNLGDLAGQPFSRGNSRIRGIDILLKKRIKTYRSWLSYTLSEAKYEFALLSSESFPSSHDHTHILQWVNQYQKGNWDYSISSQIRSGVPYTEAVGVGTRTNNQGDEVPFIQYESVNAERLKAYMKWDASVSYRFGDKSDFHGSVVFSIQNLLNRENILGRSYLLEPGISSSDSPDLISRNEIGLKRTPNIGVNLWW